MGKTFKKLKKRFIQFKAHPLTAQNPWRSFLRYLLFNISLKFKKEIVYNSLGGIKILVRKGDSSVIGNIYFGLQEFTESAFLLHFIRKEDEFLDVGANLGHYSLLASGVCGAKSICIEPVPKTYDQLLQQLKINELDELVTPFNLGISDEEGELYFSTDMGPMNRVVNEEYKNAERVNVKTIDSIVKDKDIRLIKIDVEGYENHVLKGCEKIMSTENLKAVIIELNFLNEIYGGNAEEISRYFATKGFSPYEYEPFTRTLSLLNHYNKQQFNTIFIKDLDFVTDRIKNGRIIEIRDKRI
ncbi:MAG: FkbM family methyltransferase [Bacteroidetes bacterium]|nr:FkbM family methyltransferase [Bacteroidota bacterium]